MLHHHYSPWPLLSRWLIGIGIGFFLVGYTIYWGIAAGNAWNWWYWDPSWRSCMLIGLTWGAISCWVVAEWIRDRWS